MARWKRNHWHDRCDDTEGDTYEDQITKLLHLHAGLERKLQLAALDDDVGEIEQMNLKRICVG